MQEVSHFNMADRLRVVRLLEKRKLVAECLARCVNAALGCDVDIFSDLEALQETQNSGAGLGEALIVISAPSEAGALSECDELERLGLTIADLRVVIVTDSAEMGDVSRSLARGARGHIPTNLSLDVFINALRLIEVGGRFLPADPFMSGSMQIGTASPQDVSVGPLTRRERSVAEALGKGQSNKQIAYDLNMSENTVKVHIHKIMKKLGARNRTEVALKLAGPATTKTPRSTAPAPMAHAVL